MQYVGRKLSHDGQKLSKHNFGALKNEIKLPCVSIFMLRVDFFNSLLKLFSKAFSRPINAAHGETLGNVSKTLKRQPLNRIYTAFFIFNYTVKPPQPLHRAEKSYDESAVQDRLQGGKRFDNAVKCLLD